MYITVYIYVYVYIYVCIHIYTHIYKYIYTNMHTYTHNILHVYIIVYLYNHIPCYVYCIGHRRFSPSLRVFLQGDMGIPSRGHHLRPPAPGSIVGSTPVPASNGRTRSDQVFCENQEKKNTILVIIYKKWSSSILVRMSLKQIVKN